MATTTPNFGWSVPTSTDLVKDGALNIETLGDAIDGRFGDVGTYPNQIVNRVSGVSRPVPFATAGGNVNAVFTASSTSVQSITLPAGRFSQAPLIVLTSNSAAGNFSGSTYRATSVTTTSFNLLGTATSVITNTTGVYYIAIQMTSTTAAG